MSVKFGLNQVGCWFDGVFGQEFNDRRVVDLAQEYGFSLPDGMSMEEYLDTDFDPTEEAVDYLNSLELPEGYAFSWRDGDFGLWSIDDSTDDTETESE